MDYNYWLVLEDALSKPFPEKEIKSYPSSGQTMRFINARQAMDRFDSTVGAGGWSTFYRYIDPATKAVECTITISGVSKSDVGYPNSGKDADDSNREPLKAAYRDAFKRAAVHWGVARDLYGSPRPSRLCQEVFNILKDKDDPDRDSVLNYITTHHAEVKGLKDLIATPTDVLIRAYEQKYKTVTASSNE